MCVSIQKMSLKTLVLIIVATNIVSFCVCQNNLVVTTDSGKVLGKTIKDRKGNDVYSFQSIPFAKPPVGDLRFKAPVPIEPWENILDGTSPPPICSQLANNVTVGQEDCLYLNIYKRMLPKNGSTDALKSVMVYIHGGAFTSGSSDHANPDYLLPNDVVLVTINYRLGFLGFLNFKNQSLEAPGNAGMKDQVLALKWTKRNIQYFGGNPNDITLFGISAGSASVHFHVLSPMSAGLFKKAIMQSGTGLNGWANGLRDSVTMLCNFLNISTGHENLIFDKLKKVPVEDILSVQLKIIPTFNVSEQQPAGIVVETQTNQPTFLNDTPMNILRFGKFNKVPCIIGYTSQEGIMLQYMSKVSDGDFVIIKDFEKYIPYDLIKNTTSTNTTAIAKKMEAFYANQTTNSSFVLQPSINLITDTWFYYHIYKTAMEQSLFLNNSQYFYRFSADTKLNFGKRAFQELAKYPGATHGDDVGYEFKFSYTPTIVPGSIEDISIERFSKLWTNFAKYGNPTPTYDKLFNNQLWEPFTPNKQFVLEFGNQINASVNPDLYRFKFWDEMYTP